MANVVEVPEFSPAVQGMISAGRLKVTNGEVTVSAAASPNGQELRTAFPDVELVKKSDTEAALALMDGDMDALLDAAVARYNQNRRQTVRNSLKDSALGPWAAFLGAARKLVRDFESGAIPKLPKRFRDESGNPRDAMSIAQLMHAESEE